MTENSTPGRYRITYAKNGGLKYTGHLDMHRIWERSLRRARLPLAYSQGFHPQPRLQQACALPLGFTSRCELLDAWLEEPILTADVFSVLTTAVPPGIEIQEIEQVDLCQPALQSRVESVLYRITFLESIDGLDLQGSVSGFISTSSLPREWKGKKYDLRPLVEDIFLHEEPSDLRIRLAAREGATGRPEEVLAVLGIPLQDVNVERIQLFLKPI